MLLDVKSLYVTPRSLPVMVMIVPPSIGPDLGLKSSITGAGQPDPSVIGAASHVPMYVQLSVVPLGLSHQLHSNPLLILYDKQEEQQFATPQL